MTADESVGAKQPSKHGQSIAHKPQPYRMLDRIVIMFECLTSVIRRINVNALDSAGEFFFQCFQREQVVAKDQAIVEEVILRNSLRRMIRKLWVFKQNSRFQPRPVLLPNPSQFKFCSLTGHPTNSRVTKPTQLSLQLPLERNHSVAN